MATSTDIFKTIKTLSSHTVNPCRRLDFTGLAQTSSLQKDSLLVILVELENRGLIKINNTRVVTINLTPYGSLQDSVTGGLYSED